MTEKELKDVITEITTEFIEKQAIENLFPNTSEEEVQAAFEIQVNGYYEIILSNPHLKAKLPNATRQDVENHIRTFMEEADRMTREQGGLPYQE